MLEVSQVFISPTNLECLHRDGQSWVLKRQQGTRRDGTLGTGKKRKTGEQTKVISGIGRAARKVSRASRGV